MNVDKIEGQIKETTGKLTGNEKVEIEGEIEQGVAEVKENVGGILGYVTDIFGTVIDTVTGTVSNVYNSVKETVSKVFR